MTNPVPPIMDLRLDQITPSKALIQKWAAQARYQANASAYMRQCFCEYGAEQAIELCRSWVKATTGDSLLAGKMREELLPKIYAITTEGQT